MKPLLYLFTLTATSLCGVHFHPWERTLKLHPGDIRMLGVE